MFKHLLSLLFIATAAAVFANEAPKKAKLQLRSNVPATFVVNHKEVDTKDALKEEVSLMLPPQRCVVKVEAFGYETQWRTITLDTVKTYKEEFELQPLKVPCLFVSTNEKVATLHLDGNQKVQTPCYTFLDVGKTHTFRAEAEGCHTEMITVDLADGRAKIVPITLNANSATLSLVCPTIEAEVFVNHLSYGKTPVTRDRLRPGTYTITYQAEGYLPKTVKVEIVEGETREVSTTLEPIPPEPALLSVVTEPKDARVYVNDSYRGSSNLSGIELDAGKVTVSVEKSGYRKESKTIQVEYGKEHSLTFNLQKVISQVAFSVTPATVEVKVDGAYACTTTPDKKSSYTSQLVELDLPVGKYTISLSAKYYVTKEIVVEVKENACTDLGQIPLTFKPDTKVTLKNGKQYTGAVVEEKNDMLRIMTRPGMIMPLPLKNIKTRERIHAPVAH